MDIERTIPFACMLETDGTGLWSSKETHVSVIELELSYDDDVPPGEKLYGELRVYFDTKTWNVNKDGLIYTDKQFLDDLKGCLDTHGLVDTNVEYSEQGMQGTNFVSLDVGDDFITSWLFHEWAETELPGN